MSQRRAAWLAWSSVPLYVVLVGVGLALQIRTPEEALPTDERQFAALDAVFAVVLLVFTVVGALIAARHPRHPIGWLLCALGLVNAVWSFAFGYARQALVGDPGSLPAGEAAAWLSSWVDSLSVGLVILLVLLFPDGRLPSPRWRPLGWIIGVFVIAVVLDLWLQPGRLYGFARVDNPLGVEAAAFLRGIDVLPVGFLLVAAAVAGLLVKRSRATAVERLQLKWFLFAAALLVFWLIVAAVAEATLPENEALNVAAGFLFAVLLANLAIAIGVAVLRYRLYDVDLVIRRTLVYGALTAALLAAYLGLVLLLQLALSPLTEDSDLAIAGSTLAVAALFRPARARIQAVVDRRFYRRRYDAARTVEAFSGRLRDEVELESLSAELRDVVADTMQPAHVSLWLRAPVGGER